MRIFIFLFIATLAFGVSAQQLKVVHISGDIFSQSAKRNLKIGDPISADENLSFTDPNSSCFLFDGKNKLSFSPSISSKSGSVAELFKTPISRQLITSRGNEDSSYLSVSDYFTANNYLFLNDKESFMLKSTSKIQSENLKYFIVDEKKAKRELVFKNKELQINKTTIFPENEKISLVEIYQVNMASGELKKLKTVAFHNSQNESIQKQIELIVSLQKENEEAKIITNSFSILQSIYGSLNNAEWEIYFKMNFR